MYPIHNLHAIAGALNIEAGLPCLHMKKGLWVNFILGLDNPLETQVTFDDLLEKFSSSLQCDCTDMAILENVVPEFNESRFFAFAIAVIGYYAEHGRERLDQRGSSPLHITVHIHQDGNLLSCQNLIRILRGYVSAMMDAFEFENVAVEYRSDDRYYTTLEHDYSETDILISVSQCAIVDPEIKPGEIIVANEFVPYDVTRQSVNTDQTYSVHNDLVGTLDSIVQSEYSTYAVQFVDEHYRSFNRTKDHASRFFADDFVRTKVLAANGMWNPSSDDRYDVIK